MRVDHKQRHAFSIGLTLIRTSSISMSSMKAVAVSDYGTIENLIATEVAKPDKPGGHDLLVRYD